MVTVSEAARTKVLELLKQEPREGLALRLGVQGRGPGGFVYRLAFVEPTDRAPSDHVIDAGGFDVYVDPASMPELEGARLEWVDSGREAGFRIDNPNPLWRDPMSQAIQRVLDEEINPAVAAHGGFVTLLEVKDDVAYIELGGGCQGCGMVDVTLKQGVEVRIREVVPQIRGVVDTTDHAAGSNPYYRPAKGGYSPFG